VHIRAIAALAATVGVMGLGLAAVTRAEAQRDTTDEASQSVKAAGVFREIMDTPDKGIPKDLLEKAECVAVFPSVIKAGFIVGGRGGRGVASCRTVSGWSAPAFFNLGGASFGLQIGAQSTDFVMLFMTTKSMDSLLSNEFTLGADASVAAGPVGREAGAATDLKLNAQILSYSRSKGLFAGLELKGVVIKPDTDDMRDVYGAGVTAKEVLRDDRIPVPVAARAFPTTLDSYSSRKAIARQDDSPAR
jgi:lipid-binding SYLF domain-containing protein